MSDSMIRKLERQGKLAKQEAGIVQVEALLILFKGYRPIDGAQHKTVVEMTGVFLGDAFTSLINHFETMRRKRNEMTYEAGALLSHSEAEEAFADAISLVRTILADVKAQNPQLELDL